MEDSDSDCPRAASFLPLSRRFDQSSMNMLWNLNRRALSCVLASTLLLSRPSVCEQVSPAPADQSQASSSQAPGLASLRVKVLQGDGAVHNVMSGRATPLVVEVREQNDRPVEGAEVTFQLPLTGPGGFFFPAQSLTQTVRTNFQGQAVAAGFRPNAEQGSFEVKVNVSYGNQARALTVTQYNSRDLFSYEPAHPKPKPFYKKTWFIAALAGGATAAGLGIYYTTRPNGSSSSTSLSLVPGAVVIGPPH